MSFAGGCVSRLLRSPFHGLLSGSTDLIRYKGRRFGREITTPTQYANCGDDVLILVGRPETKTWWCNFRSERDLDVLVRGQWSPMTALAVVGADGADAILPLLDAYLTRFPRAQRTLGDGTPRRARTASRGRELSTPLTTRSGRWRKSRHVQ